MAAPNLNNATSVTMELLYAGQLATAAEITVYTVPANKSVLISTISLANINTVSAVIAISLVPSGGTATSLNRIRPDFVLGAGETITQDDLLAGFRGAMLSDGSFISISTSLATSINVHITGTVTA